MGRCGDHARADACHRTESSHPCMPSAASKGRTALTWQPSVSVIGHARGGGKIRECGTTSRRINISRRDGTCLTARLKASDTSRRLHRSRPASPRQESCWRRSSIVARWNTSSSEVFRVALFLFCHTHKREKRDEGKKEPGSRCHEGASRSLPGQGGPLYC